MVIVCFLANRMFFYVLYSSFLLITKTCFNINVLNALVSVCTDRSPLCRSLIKAICSFIAFTLGFSGLTNGINFDSSSETHSSSIIAV